LLWRRNSSPGPRQTSWRSSAEPNCTIRLIHYPPHPNSEENEFGFAPHTDNNFLTFLAQSALPGLEVRTAEGEWIRPPALPGTFVVNTGAMLARYSNDRFRATPHRVINQNEGSRYAIPFFLGPNHDSVVECVPTCVGPTTRRATNRRPTAPSVSGC
jgi:isopenicillin N synthase-like dioxygenase